MLLFFSHPFSQSQAETQNIETTNIEDFECNVPIDDTTNVRCHKNQIVKVDDPEK